jgi:nitrile hydratase accessory protein
VSASPHELPLEIEDRPAFEQPWEASAFALAVQLHRAGAFEWPELAAELGARIAARPDAAYYEHWLAAVKSLVVAHGIATADELDATTQAWHEAAEATPHGKPILLHGTRER